MLATSSGLAAFDAVRIFARLAFIVDGSFTRRTSFTSFRDSIPQLTMIAGIAISNRKTAAGLAIVVFASLARFVHCIPNVTVLAFCTSIQLVLGALTAIWDRASFVAFTVFKRLSIRALCAIFSLGFACRTALVTILANNS